MPEPTAPPPYERPDLPFERTATPLAQAGRWSAAGLEFGLSVVLFFLGGNALDAKLSTSPWLAVAGSLFGIAVGTWLLVRPLLPRRRGASPRSRPGDRPRSERGKD